MTGVDVFLPLEIASVDASIGRTADLQGPRTEQPELAGDRAFGVVSPQLRPNRPYAERSISACASAISGISGVGAKPSSAGARTAWPSAGRAVD